MMNFRFALAFAGLLCLSTIASAGGKVVVYNWSEYIPEALLEQFTKETGITVEYSTYDNNEVMYSRLKLQEGRGYDLVVPSTYYIDRMRREGLLQKLDGSRLSNLKHLNPALLDKPYDPGNAYSVPYLWGSTGIGVNAEDIDPATITSWADLWDERFARSLLLIDDIREVFHVALRVNGHSANSTDPAEIEQAYERLQGLMPNVLTFNADAPREPFLAGDVSVGMIWSGEVIMAREENPALEYIYPEEGAIFWIDNFAIPSGAENVAEAHAFIDFMLRPQSAALTVEEIGFATPNLEGIKLLDAAIRNDPVIFPPAEVLQAGEFQVDVGPALEFYNQYWERLKTGG